MVALLLILIALFAATFFFSYTRLLRIIVFAILFLLLFLIFKTFLYLLPVIFFLWLVSFALRPLRKKRYRENNFQEKFSNYYRQAYRENFDSFRRQQNFFTASKKKHYCQILEVSENATAAEIKEQYRKLVKSYHPDTITAPEEKKKFEAKFKQINEAYHFLKKNSVN